MSLPDLYARTRPFVVALLVILLLGAAAAVSAGDLLPAHRTAAGLTATGLVVCSLAVLTVSLLPGRGRVHVLLWPVALLAAATSLGGVPSPSTPRLLLLPVVATTFAMSVIAVLVQGDAEQARRSGS